MHNNSAFLPCCLPQNERFFCGCGEGKLRRLHQQNEFIEALSLNYKRSEKVSTSVLLKPPVESPRSTPIEVS